MDRLQKLIYYINGYITETDIAEMDRLQKWI